MKTARQRALRLRTNPRLRRCHRRRRHRRASLRKTPRSLRVGTLALIALVAMGGITPFVRAVGLR